MKHLPTLRLFLLSFLLNAMIGTCPSPRAETPRVGETNTSEEAPTSAQDFYALALDYEKRQQLKEAIDACARASRLDSENVDYLVTRAQLFGQTRQLDQALQESEKILKIDQKNVDARLLRARIFELRGEHDKTLVELSEAIERNPTNVKVFAERRDFYQRRGEREKALADCDRIIQLQDSPVPGYLSRAQIHSVFDDHDQAIEYATKVIALDPTNWLAFHIRGCSYLKKLDPKKAEEDFSQALQLAPNPSLVHAARFGLYRDAGRYEKAWKELLRAEELDPQDYMVKAALGEFLAACPQDNLRDPEKAGDYIAKALQLNSNFPPVWDAVATVAADRGDFDEAIRWQEKYLQWNGLTSSDQTMGEQHLKLYRAHHPYRYRPKTTGNLSISASTSPAPVEK